MIVNLVTPGQTFISLTRTDLLDLLAQLSEISAGNQKGPAQIQRKSPWGNHTAIVEAIEDPGWGPNNPYCRPNFWPPKDKA